MSLGPLGDSAFSYDDYFASRFHHHWLEIRLGDHTVTDCVGDVRLPFPMTEEFERVPVCHGHFISCEGRASVDDNCVFYVLRSEKEPSS